MIKATILTVLAFSAFHSPTERRAEAGNLNVSGTLCQSYSGSQALEIDYLPRGVRNLASSSRNVICSVPRTHVPNGVYGEFFVNGYNYPHSSTTCTVHVISYLGVPRASSTFTKHADNNGSWEQRVAFAPGIVTTWDYVSVLCNMPGNGLGHIHGIIAMQP